MTGPAGPARDNAEHVDLVEHRDELAAAVRAGRTVPAGRLMGLPELPDGDVWVDIAGASVLSGVEPRTITGWLSRGRPAACPYPAPSRILYRLYWPRAVVTEWAAAYAAQRREDAR